MHQGLSPPATAQMQFTFEDFFYRAIFLLKLNPAIQNLKPKLKICETLSADV